MDIKAVKRSKLTEVLKGQKDVLKKDVFMITSVRATRDGSLQVEVCQNRMLAGRVATLLGILNRSDERFRSETTLLFDWLQFKAEDFKKAFPGVKISVKDLKEIADSWSETAPTGKDALVYAILEPIASIRDEQNGTNLTPVITVTEVTESQLRNGEFFRGAKADERIASVLDNDNNVMRTGSGDDAEYLVHPETGEKIFRFTRVEFKENNPVDSLIQGKVTESDYAKRSANTSKKEVGTDHLKALLMQGDSI